MDLGSNWAANIFSHESESEMFLLEHKFGGGKSNSLKGFRVGFVEPTHLEKRCNLQIGNSSSSGMKMFQDM